MAEDFNVEHVRLENDDSMMGDDRDEPSEGRRGDILVIFEKAERRKREQGKVQADRCWGWRIATIYNGQNESDAHNESMCVVAAESGEQR